MEQAAPPTERAYRGTNGLAIASLVLSIIWIWGLGSLLAVIFGAIAMKQTSRRPQGGHGLAVAGLVIGIVGLAGAILFTIAAISASNSTDAYNACINHAQTYAQLNHC